MEQVVIIIATMADGTVIRERTADFGRFVTLALAFRADPACVRLVWVVIDPPPRPPAHAAAVARLPLPQAAAAWPSSPPSTPATSTRQYRGEMSAPSPTTNTTGLLSSTPTATRRAAPAAWS